MKIWESCSKYREQFGVLIDRLSINVPKSYNCTVVVMLLRSILLKMEFHSESPVRVRIIAYIRFADIL